MANGTSEGQGKTRSSLVRTTPPGSALVSVRVPYASSLHRNTALEPKRPLHLGGRPVAQHPAGERFHVLGGSHEFVDPARAGHQDRSLGPKALRPPAVRRSRPAEAGALGMSEHNVHRTRRVLGAGRAGHGVIMTSIHNLSAGPINTSVRAGRTCGVRRSFQSAYRSATLCASSAIALAR